MKNFGSSLARGAFLGSGILLAAGMAQADPLPYTEMAIQGHRCLVAAPQDLPPEAPVVLILHGLGGSRYDLLGLCDGLHLPPCLFVLPDGPLQVPHSSSEARGWYDRITHSRSDIERSRDYLFGLMDYFSRMYPDPPAPGHPRKARPVIIMGFSQGAVMSLEAGLNYKGRIEAIVSMSGYMGEPEKTLAHRSAPLKTPILLTHGTMDVVVQEDSTQQTLEALRRAGYHPVLREFTAGHHLTADMVIEVSQFLHGVFPRK